MNSQKGREKTLFSFFCRIVPPRLCLIDLMNQLVELLMRAQLDWMMITSCGLLTSSRVSPRAQLAVNREIISKFSSIRHIFATHAKEA